LGRVLHKETKGTKNKNFLEDAGEFCLRQSLAIRFHNFHAAGDVLRISVAMPIPALTPEGLLPPGIFECSQAEIKDRFGSFRGSDARPRLFKRFEEVVEATKSVGLFTALIVDGSFVTAKAVPMTSTLSPA
jgi:hypothetical protein